jgi:hypothetical protein
LLSSLRRINIMNWSANQFTFASIGPLLRGELDTIVIWSGRWSAQRFLLQVIVITLGAGLYGAAVGWWRAPEQALFTAIKFPLIVLLTTVGNALLNAMLAPLLGLNITFRQCFSGMLMSFTIAAAILGAFSPLIGFMIWNAPPIASAVSTRSTYNLILLINVLAIALAGVTGNARLFQLLAQLSGSRTVALRVLFAWLAGNLFLGSQLSWILRPFIGAPTLPVEFLRASALHGNFFETVFRSLQQILQLR